MSKRGEWIGSAIVPNLTEGSEALPPTPDRLLIDRPDYERLRAIEAAAKEWLAAQEHLAAIKAAIHRGEYCGERAASPDWLLAWQRYWAAEDRLREVLKEAER